MSAEKTEAIEITVAVEIKYSTARGRTEAIKWAERHLHLNGWSTSAGGFAAKRIVAPAVAK